MHPGSILCKKVLCGHRMSHCMSWGGLGGIYCAYITYANNWSYYLLMGGTTFVLSLWGLNIIRDPKRCAPEFSIIVSRVFAVILEEGILWLIGWRGVFTSVKDAGEKWQKMLWTKDTVCHSHRFRLLFHMFRPCIIEIAFAMRDSWMVPGSEGQLVNWCFGRKLNSFE